MYHNHDICPLSQEVPHGIFLWIPSFRSVGTASWYRVFPPHVVDCPHHFTFFLGSSFMEKGWIAWHRTIPGGPLWENFRKAHQRARSFLLCQLRWASELRHTYMPNFFPSCRCNTLVLYSVDDTYRLNRVPSPKIHVHPEPVNGTLFRNTIFADVIKWRISCWTHPGSRWP